jgi:membrane protease YdiL (CAAX protease family)
VVRPSWNLWAFLLLVIAAELLLTFVSAPLGLALHALILIALMLQSAAEPPGPPRNLTLALTLVPLTRLLSLSLPLATFPRLDWYPIVTVPLLIAWWGAFRTLDLTGGELGLRSDGLALQLALAGGGLGLGAIEYRILQPQILVANASFDSFLVAALILIVFTGLAEELIFRGLLQHLASQVAGSWGLIYVSLLFAALHVGYRSFDQVVFAFSIGLLFAMVVRGTGSILGVSLAHGLVNVTLFLVMPYVAQNPPALVQSVVSWIILAGAGLSIIALAVVAWTVASEHLSVRRRTRASELEFSQEGPDLQGAGNALPIIEAPALGLVKAFQGFPDPQGNGGQHPLPAILALATCAMLCGARSVNDVAQWGRDQDPETLMMFGLTNKKRPGAPTYHRIFSELDPAAFEAAVLDWAEQILPGGRHDVTVNRYGLRGLRGARLPGVFLTSRYAHVAGPRLQESLVRGRTPTEPFVAGRPTGVPAPSPVLLRRTG